MTLNSDTVALVNIADKGVFHEIFLEHYTPLCLFAGKFTKDSDIAADIVQDAFVALWSKRENFSNLPQVRSFLYTCVRNKALNELKHIQVVQQHSEELARLADEAGFHEEVVRSEVFRIMRNEISRLPKQMGTIMDLSLNGLKNKEIAEKMNITLNTVRTLKKLAYKKLRKSLGHRIFVLLLILIKTF